MDKDNNPHLIDKRFFGDLSEEGKIVTGVIDIAPFSFDLMKIYDDNYCAGLGMICEEIPNRVRSIHHLERYSRGIGVGARILLNRRFPVSSHDNPVTVKALLNNTSGKDYGEILWEHGETLSDTIFLVMIGTAAYIDNTDPDKLYAGASRAGDYSVFPKGRKVTLTLDGGTALLILEKHSYINEM